MRALIVVAVAVAAAACGSPTVQPPTPAVTASTNVSPSPSAARSAPTPTATPLRLPADDAWALVRSTIPSSIAVPKPVWLPAGLDSGVRVSELRAVPATYVVEYLRSGETALTLSLGRPARATGSAIGTRVRGVPATLWFSPYLSPGERGWRSLAWNEPAAYVVESEILTGEDVLHVGWSIDRTGQPASPYAIDRTRAGACASATSAEDTVRAYVATFGTHDAARMLDCFAIDYLNGAGSLGFAQGTADLPRATIDHIGPIPPATLAGRFQLGVTWTFEREPVGWAQGQHGFLMFTVGIKEGRYRIFEGGTGAYGPPP